MTALSINVDIHVSKVVKPLLSTSYSDVLKPLYLFSEEIPLCTNVI